MLRLRGRENFLVRRRLCQEWARSYAYPGSISGPHTEALSIREKARGVKACRCRTSGCQLEGDGDCRVA